MQILVNHLMTLPEVVTAYIVTGRWDILLSVRARSHQALQDFVVGILPGVARIRAQRDHVVLAGPAQKRRGISRGRRSPRQVTSQ